ncbi:MAG: hypothetical protein H6828_09205, partial [Planctomycetes bacterium]|nr:hypothetical protein [Planctomycetota bacterium]
MMRLRRRALGLGLLGAALLVTAAGAHVRLRHPSNRNPLFWNDPANVS